MMSQPGHSDVYSLTLLNVDFWGLFSTLLDAHCATETPELQTIEGLEKI